MSENINIISEKDNFSEEKENKNIYEYGAHFKYQDLYNKLFILKKKSDNLNLLKNTYNSLNDPNIIPGKSRNIQLNNRIRSINIYLKEKNKNKNVNKAHNLKVKTNKTSFLLKSERIKSLNKQIEKVIKEKKNKKENKNNYINNKKKENKSSSHPKRSTLVNFTNQYKNKKNSITNKKSISSSKSTRDNYKIKSNRNYINKNSKLNFQNLNIIIHKQNINNKKAHSTSQKKINKLKLNYGKTINNNQKNSVTVTTSKSIKKIGKNNIELFPINFMNKNMKSKSISNEKKSNKLINQKLEKSRNNNIKYKDNTFISIKKKKYISQNNSLKRNSKSNPITNRKKYEYEKLSQKLIKNKNLKNRLKYTTPNNYSNTSINKINSSLIKNKIITPNVTVILDNKFNEKKKIEQKKNISRNNIHKEKSNNTFLNKKNNNIALSILKMKKQINLLKKNTFSNSIKKKIISSSNSNINSTFNSTNKSLNQIYKNNINPFKKNNLLSLFDNPKENRTKNQKIKITNQPFPKDSHLKYNKKYWK